MLVCIFYGQCTCQYITVTVCIYITVGFNVLFIEAAAATTRGICDHIYTWTRWSITRFTLYNVYVWTGDVFLREIIDAPWHPPQLVLRTAPWQYLWQPRMHFTATALLLVRGPNTREPSCFEFIGVAAVDEERSLNFCCCSKIKYGSLK